MAKLQEGVEQLLGCFKGAIGSDAKFALVVNQTASMLGNVKLDTTDGAWKVSNKGLVSQGNKTKGFIPLGNASAVLYLFAKQLDEVSGRGKFLVNASLPPMCQDWIDHILDAKPEKKPADKAAA